MIPKNEETNKTKATYSNATWTFNEAGYTFNESGVAFGGSDNTQDAGPVNLSAEDIVPQNIQAIPE